MHYLYPFSCYPLINPRVNLNADILPVNRIPKFVIANEEDVATAWPFALLLISGICVIAFDTVVIVPSVTF
jgi:hypothetical protein